MKIRKLSLMLFSTIAFAFLLIVHACTKREHDLSKEPINPYSNIHRDDTTSYGIKLDSLTITYVHKMVLSPRCALPGCHDGHFEPDYRTPQSSYSTLVYASIIKNDTTHKFKYRVVPFDTAYSVLYQRITNCCFISRNDRMPQDNIGVPLPDSSINLIASWIMHGARDMFGNVARLPNQEPVINNFTAFDTISFIPPFMSPTVEYDTIRQNGLFSNPFVVPVNKAVFYMMISMSDDSTPIGAMLVNELKISTDIDDYSSAWQYTATFSAASEWFIAIPTNNLPVNTRLYMRYYVNDGSHSFNTEFPRNDLLGTKEYWSFIRQ